MKHPTQGSKLGPVLFNSYIAPVSDIAKKHGIIDEKYADDTQLILSFKPDPLASQINAVERMKKCIEDIRSFLHENKLCNNGEKTEFLLIGTTNQLKKLEINSIKVDDIAVKAVDHARNLGVMFDKHMGMEKQVNKMCKNVYFNIRNIARIRKSLTKTDLKTVVNSLVTPHLDYGNALLTGITTKLEDKLQVAQNSAVRLVEKVSKYEHVTKYRKALHWLPIPARIEFKLLTMTWKTLNNQAPEYMSELIQRKQNERNLRSSHKIQLETHQDASTNTFVNRAFSRAAPKLWNPLPENLKTKQSLEAFKKGLKTHLFNHYYKE